MHTSLSLLNVSEIYRVSVKVTISASSSSSFHFSTYSPSAFELLLFFLPNLFQSSSNDQCPVENKQHLVITKKNDYHILNSASIVMIFSPLSLCTKRPKFLAWPFPPPSTSFLLLPSLTSDPLVVDAQFRWWRRSFYFLLTLASRRGFVDPVFCFRRDDRTLFSNVVCVFGFEMATRLVLPLSLLLSAVTPTPLLNVDVVCCFLRRCYSGVNGTGWLRGRSVFEWSSRRKLLMCWGGEIYLRGACGQVVLGLRSDFQNWFVN